MLAAIATWFATNGIQLLISLAITIAERAGWLTPAKAAFLKAGYKAEHFVSHLQTFPEYPTGKSGESSPPPAKVYNFTTGQSLEPKP